ncbi:class I SAM-dependent RNA methyltransferase [Alicyclobacillus sp. SO9]|uniref:THUMP domain-containing class I SAM-dependent RNA methyltransferase n=1 Tax=Alicyclobacillus sp. SO9 TaxID=2665646 RepID=UPI0018E8979C|nr:class I SAM-dependent RNA methyltransferase [Alicyclobacillus sp. SO9]QQE78267.1 class I SAM-dependent RNA methyltransferase [Alicyclobacillus sp. SO9]
MTQFRLIASTAFGLEAVAKRELQSLGVSEIQAYNGYVEFVGDELTIARANLWLRTVNRVFIKVGQFTARTFEELFEQTKALPWPELLSKDANFPVNGRSLKSQLSSVPACQSIVKKAVVESLKERYRMEKFPETGPRYTIEVSLLKDEAVITLDTSGEGLHKRGYRKLTASAPIRETLAAALVLLSRWGPHRPFADPLCGSGTIAIEAAMIGSNLAPGHRRTFASEHFIWMDKGSWNEARQEVEDTRQRSASLEILAGDIDKEVLSLAEYHARQAGVGPQVQIVHQDVAKFQPDDPYGCIITNPPYGERLWEEREVRKLYQTMGKSFARLDTWSKFVITSYPDFERVYGDKADKKRKLYNGRIQTNFYQYLGPLPPRKPHD